MRTISEVSVRRDASVRQVMEMIDRNGLQLAVVVGDDMKMLGVVTDGDIRRSILRGISTDESVEKIMSTSPITAKPGGSREELLARMTETRLLSLPVVDDDGYALGVHVLADQVGPRIHENWVVIMAGGLGTRLHPLTHETPKPLLHVGDRPILETIIELLVAKGFRRIFLSVNYMADKVMEYFGNGERWGVKIEYLQEDEYFGTAGALSLLPEAPKLPLVVMNGDLLTKVDFSRLLDFHVEHQSGATMCVKEYDFKIPYGVVKVDDCAITSIVEKPVHTIFANAGIYVIEPWVLDFVPKQSYFDMPSLFQYMGSKNMSTVAFPIREYWLDIGNHEDFKRANKDYDEEFSPPTIVRTNQVKKIA